MENAEIQEEVKLVTDWPDEEEDNYRPISKGERLKPWQFEPGKSGNPGGKPKGPTLKHFAREYLASMSKEERLEYMRGLPKMDIWRMAEGNPSEDKNVTISVPRPILGGITQNPVDTPHSDVDSAPSTTSMLVEKA